MPSDTSISLIGLLGLFGALFKINTSYGTRLSGESWRITNESLVLSRFTHQPLGKFVNHAKKLQVTSGIYHGAPRESVA